MPTTTWETWADLLLPSLPGCSLPMAVLHLRETAIDFCARTSCWYYEHPAINVVAGTHTYAWVPPSGAVVHEVLTVWYSGRRIYKRAPQRLARMYRDWLTQTAREPTYYTQQDERNLRLVPIPTVSLASGVKATVLLKPAPDAAGLETRLYEEYRSDIVHGVLERLMRVPKKPWSDAQQANVERALYEEAVDTVAGRVARGLVGDSDIVFRVR